MREIKFRFWLPFELGSRMLYDPYLGRARCDKIFNKYTMQFIGLKDKNGKEIYEKDMIKVKNYYLSDEPHYSILQVVWRDFGWCLIDKYGEIHVAGDLGYDDNFICKDVEVIGNIYENPELLVRIIKLEERDI